MMKRRLMPGGGVLEFGGSSKSSSASTSTVSAEDRRFAVDSGIGIANENNGAQVLGPGVALNFGQSYAYKGTAIGPTVNLTNNIQSLDADVVSRALDTVDRTNAIAGQSLDDLLTLTATVFDRGATIAQTAMEQTGAAYDLLLARKEETDSRASGQLDQRTVVVLAIAGAAVAAVALRRGR